MRRKTLVLYVHGKDGTACEAEHYQPIFPNCDVVGLEYKADTPWDAKTEFPTSFEKLSVGYNGVILIANSIGAYLSMCALPQEKTEKAYFISPVVDMEKLICNMMAAIGVSEDELRQKVTVKTDFGETLSFEYLSYVSSHPVVWNVPTDILYGEHDGLTDIETLTAFATNHKASITVMENGEHWFHTPEQMAFLDSWLTRKQRPVLETRRLVLRPWCTFDAENL